MVWTPILPPPPAPLAAPGWFCKLTISPSGIVSEEAIGSAHVALKQYITVTGIASAEAFGSDHLVYNQNIVDTPGISSAEAFGSAAVSPGPVNLAPGGIASSEAFGSAAISVGPVFILPTGMVSSEAFGLPTIVPGPVNISVPGISTAEAFGTFSTDIFIDDTGIGSSEVFGTPTIVPGPVTVDVTGNGIVSAEAFGTPAIQLTVSFINGIGIDSAEAFGTPQINQSIAGTGIASAEAFGTAQLNQTLYGTGIGSAEAFGTATIIQQQFVAPTGIASAEAFGTAFVSGKANSLVDTFTSEDDVKWNYTDWPGATVTGGQLQIVGTPAFAGPASWNWYDLRSSSASVELIQSADNGGGSSGYTYTFFGLFDLQTSCWLSMFIISGILYFRQDTTNLSGGGTSDSSITYDPVAHRYWRIRESGGTVYWETSPEGATWTTQRTLTPDPGIHLYSMQEFIWHYWNGASGSSPGTSIWDNVNVPGQLVVPSGIISTETFGSPSVAPGPATVDLTGNGIVSAEAFGTAQLNQTLYGTGIASAEAFGSDTVVPPTAPGPQWIDAASVESTTLTMPAHQTGDVLVMFAFRDGSTTLPTLPSGWTQINSIGANTCSAIVAYKVAASSSEVSGTWTSTTFLICDVYRNASGVVATSIMGTGSSATVNYPALTMLNTAGTSLVAAYGGHRSINDTMGTPPTGMTNRNNLAGATADGASHDTNGLVSSWSSQNVVTAETASGYITAVVEVLPVGYEINTARSAVAIPTGLKTGVYVTLIGGGGGAGRGSASSSAPPGGQGGGGGAGIQRTLVPLASLGSTYTVVVGVGGTGTPRSSGSGSAGTASTFSSGSVSMSAGGGGIGANSSSSTPTNGGTVSVSGITATSTNGANGAAGSGTTTGSSSTGIAGAGGGGGNSGHGGSSATVTGPTSEGVAGGNAALGGGGAGGAGGGDCGSGSCSAIAGGNGGTSGGGGGGGGSAGSVSGSGGPGGNGGAGCTILQWV